MNRRRISVNVQQQILFMRDKGIGIRRIAKTLKIARNTVRDFLRDFDNQKNNPASASEIESTNQEPANIDWPKVHDNFNKGVPLKTLWRENCFNEDRTYSSFYHEYRRHYLKQPEVTMRLNHKPGEKIF